MWGSVRMLVQWQVESLFDRPHPAALPGEPEACPAPGVRSTIACFELSGVRAALGFLEAPAPRRRAALAPELEREWLRYGLSGAVLLYPRRDELPPEEELHRVRSGVEVQGYSELPLVQATDPLLVLNVLARARGGLLLPGFSLVLEREFLRRRLVTDDPRLVTLARQSR